MGGSHWGSGGSGFRVGRGEMVERSSGSKGEGVVIEPGDEEILNELTDKMTWEQFLEFYSSLTEILRDGPEKWQTGG